VCPECGEFVASLNPSTGWCFDCSPVNCERCGGPRTSDHKFCISCQRLNWLERNADRIEELISEGYTFSQAKSKILGENRAICIICSSEIPGKHKSNTLFCKKNKGCRKARKIFFALVSNGMPQSEALEQTLREVAL